MAVQVGLTPEEAAWDAANNLSEGNLAELEREIRRAKDPKIKATLVAERERILRDDPSVAAGAPPAPTTVHRQEAKEEGAEEFLDSIFGISTAKGRPGAAPTAVRRAETADEFLNGIFGGVLEEAEKKPAEPSGGFARRAGDAAIDLLAKGPVALGESAVGLLDILTLGGAGSALAIAGYDPKRTREILEGYYSDARKAANKEVGDAKGFVDTTLSMIQNPSTIAGMILESLPGTVGIAGVARQFATKVFVEAGKKAAAVGPLTPAMLEKAGREAVEAALPRILAVAAGAEGAQAAGSIAEQARQANRDWSEYVLPALAGGTGTAVIGLAGGKIAGTALGKKLGMADVETGIATAGMRKEVTEAPGLAKRVVGSAVREGVLEEMPQSAQEQAMQNIAEGKPVGEDVGKAAAQGMLAGSGMGGLYGAVSRPREAAPETAPATAPAVTVEAAAAEAPVVVSAEQVRALAGERIEELAARERLGPAPEKFVGRDENGNAIFEKQEQERITPAERRELRNLRAALNRKNDDELGAILGVQVGGTDEAGQQQPDVAQPAAGTATAADQQNLAAQGVGGAGAPAAAAGERVAPAGTRIVAQEELPDSDTEVEVGIGGQNYKATRLGKRTFGYLQRLSKALFNKDIVLVEHQNASKESWFNGITMPDDNNIYLSRDATDAHASVVFGHELGHHLRKEAGETWGKLADTVISLANPDWMQRMRAQYTGSEGLSDEAVKEEMVNDILGNRFGEKQFWTQLFQRIEQQDGQPAMQRVFNAVKGWFTNLLTRARVRGFETDSYVKDLAAARTAVVDAMSDYIKIRSAPAAATAAPAAAPEPSAAEAARAFRAQQTEALTREPSLQEILSQRAEQGMRSAVRTRGEERVMEEAARHLTGDEAAKLRPDLARKMVDLLTKLPTAKEMAAVAHAGRAKRGWYRESAEAIMRVFGPDAPRFAAMLAATSPQTSVEYNLLNALTIWKNWVQAGRPTTDKEILDIMGDSVLQSPIHNRDKEQIFRLGAKLGMKLDGGKDAIADRIVNFANSSPENGQRVRNYSVLDAWVKNTQRALTAAEPASLVLSGPKVNSFFRNLLGHVNEVTNDAWMAAYAAVDQKLFGGTLNVSGTEPGKRPGYLAMSARVRETSKLLTKLTGDTWTPVEVQETIWAWAKTLYEMRERAGEQRTMPEILSDTDAINQLIQATPDFGSLFNERIYQDLLAEAGLDPTRARSDWGGRAPAVAAVAADAGQKAPFAGRTQGQLERQAAARLEGVKQQRDKEGKKSAFRVTDKAYVGNGLAIQKGDNLLPEQRAVEESAARMVIEDLDGTIARYGKLDGAYGGRYLNTDLARELVPEYAASKASRALHSASVHEPMSFLVKKMYERRLAMPRDPKRNFEVFFTAGGTGSGKTTGLKTYAALYKRAMNADMIYDTNLNTLGSSMQKISQALRSGRDATVMFVYRDPVTAFVEGTLPRAVRQGRAVPLAEHLRTHVGVATTVPQLRREFGGNRKVYFIYLDNGTQGYGKKNAVIIQPARYNEFDRRMQERASDEAALHKELIDGLRESEVAGRVSEDVVRGTLGGSGEVPREGRGRGAGEARGDRGGRDVSRLAEGRGNVGRGEGQAGPAWLTREPSGEAQYSKVRNKTQLSIGDAPPAKTGEAFVVYRAATSAPQLAGRNAGNSDGVARYLANMDDIDAPSYGAEATHVHAFLVRTTKPFGDYDVIVRGARDRAPREEAPVGKFEHQGGAVAYSFERGGAWTAEYLGSVPIEDLRKQLSATFRDVTKERGRVTSFDDAGSAIGGEAIRRAFAPMVRAHGKEVPNRSAFRVQEGEAYWPSIEKLIERMENGATEFDRKVASTTKIPVMQTPDALRAVRALRHNRYVVSTAGNVWMKGTDQHHESKHGTAIPRETLERLPELLADPIAIYHKSEFDKRNQKVARTINGDTFLVITRARLPNGDYVAAAVAPDKYAGQMVNFVKSVHPRTPQQINTYAQHLLYYDEREARNKTGLPSAGPTASDQSTGQSRGPNGWLTVPTQRGAVKIPSRSDVENRQLLAQRSTVRTPENEAARQAADLAERAREEGYETLDDLLLRDPRRFNELAAEWRADNPLYSKFRTQLTHGDSSIRNRSMYVGNRKVGETTVYRDGTDTAHLSSIFVRPDMRGEGLGSATVDAFVRDAKELVPNGRYITAEVVNQRIYDMLKRRLGEPTQIGEEGQYSEQDLREYLPTKPDAKAKQLTWDRKMYVRWLNEVTFEDAKKSTMRLVQSKAFEKWFGNSVVVHNDGSPKMVLHGTFGDFVEFDPQKTYESSYAGRGIYLTDSPVDASENYANRLGPDVDWKVRQYRDEQVLGSEEWGPEELMAWWQNNRDRNRTEPLSPDEERAAALAIAEQEVLGIHGPHIMPLFARIEKPFKIGYGNDSTRFNMRDVPRMRRALEKLADEVDDESVAEAGLRVFVNEVHDKGRVFADWIIEEGLGLEVTDARTGEFLNNGSIANRLARYMGFDGIQMNAGYYFGPRMPQTRGATHYVAFDSSQVKSAIGNAGTYGRHSRNILRSAMRTNIANAIANTNLPSGFVGAVRDNLSDIIRPTEAEHFNWFHRSIGTQLHKARVNPFFSKVFNLGQKFLDDVAMFAMRAQSLAPDILPNLGKLSWKALRGGVSSRDNELLGQALAEGTLQNGPDPHTGVVWTDADLRSRYNMNDYQISLYRQARAAIDQSLDDIGKAQMAQMARTAGVPQAVIEQQMEQHLTLPQVQANLTAALNQLPQTRGRDNALKTVRSIGGETAVLKGAGYAPLMRFGKYTVTVHDRQGNREWFSMHETKAEAQRTKDRVMASQYPASQGYTAQTGEMNEESYKRFAGVSPATIEAFFNNVPLSNATEEAMRQAYMQMAISNRSAMSRMMRREGVPGFSKDATRNLAHFIASNSRQASKIVNMPQLLRAAEEATEQGGGDIGAEADKLIRYISDPAEGAQKFRSFLFFNFLGGSIAAGLVNLSQPVMMTLPYLSRYGVARASSALAKSLRHTGNWLRNNRVSDPVLNAAMKRAQELGIIEPQEVFQLMAAAESGAGSLLQHKFMRVWGYNFAITEAFNRTLTFGAAYDMARQMTPQQLSASGAANAFDFAVRAVEDTQGLYNKGNRPNWARETGPLGALGTVMFTFKQYSIAYVEFLKRLYGDGLLPKKEFLMAIGVLMLAAGANGLPGSDDIDDLIDTLGNWLGYPTNSKKFKRDILLSLGLDETGADFVQRGISTFLPLDIQSRLGVGNLVPGTALFSPTKADKSREATDVLGPAGGVVQNLVDTAKAAAKGDVRGALLAPLPKAVRDLAMGIEMARTGQMKDLQGRLVRKSTPADAAVKAAGFMPEDAAREAYEERVLKADVDIVKAKKQEIHNKLARALAEGDADARGKAMRELAEWNRSADKDYRIVINPRAVSQQAMQMRMTREQRFTKAAPKEQRGEVQRRLQALHVD